MRTVGEIVLARTKGVTLEIIADPKARVIYFYDRSGHFERVDATVKFYTPPSVSSLTLSLRAMFAESDIPELSKRCFFPTLLDKKIAQFATLPATPERR